MPRGRSTFSKRQKEQARQQKQRDKNERKTQRKEEKPEGGVVDEVDEMREMRELAEAQAALFRIGSGDENGAIQPPIPHRRGRRNRSYRPPHSAWHQSHRSLNPEILWKAARPRPAFL